MPPAFAGRVSAGLLVLLTGALPARAQNAAVPEPGPSSPEAIRAFLLQAKIVDSHSVGKGVTGITRLTLSDGVVSHDAAFQDIDERKMFTQFARGGAEIGFADSYHFNVAGYELAVVLGLGHMVPVTVERRWRGQDGSLSWWMMSRFDEKERLSQKVTPPDIKGWNEQMYRVRVFSALIYDTDRNLTNLLITDDWRLWMIDFSRAFRRREEIQHPGDLTHCDRHLLARLEGLTEADVRAVVGRHLNKDEIEALMTRRDLLVAHFRKLIAEKGEAAVLYPPDRPHPSE